MGLVSYKRGSREILSTCVFEDIARSLQSAIQKKVLFPNNACTLISTFDLYNCEK